MQTTSPTALGMKIVMMAIALCGVFYVMSQLRLESRTEPGVDSKNPLALLFGADIRPLNWCPETVQRLVIDGPTQENITDPVQIQSYCQILMNSFDNTTLEKGSFKPVLRAIGADNKSIFIEADSTGKIFRFQGLPFGSKQLSRQLDKKFQR
ncbi:MAG: hypothetical protein IPM97_03930 [Bdellovibrionaceae bacterium]|nr:hypothetical protein [Pseudobdellovibrionaceae bacterium]